MAGEPDTVRAVSYTHLDVYKRQVYEGVDTLHPEDIADVIAFVLDRPLRVQISDIVIMADQQATGFMVSKTPRVPHK